MACEGETITIERATEESERPTRARPTPTEGPESTRRSVFSTGGTPTVVPTASGRIAFPLLSDGAALTALYDAAGGDDWANSEGWLASDDLGLWHGVTTDGEGRVTGLVLSENRLSGELPEGLGNLTGMTELDLSQNQLDGSLPDGLAELTNLEELYLNNNQFSGALPAGLGALTGLTDLWLHDNCFSGELPTELATLPDLDSATIWGNRYSWADSYAPGLLADMVGLVALYDATGGDNWSDRSGWLSDPSVAAWSGVSIDGEGRVTGLDLSENRLSGELPPELGNLTSLTRLLLHSNQLGGEIPTALGRLTGLTELSLHLNQLGGNLPAEMGNLTGLQRLDLSANALSGEIPASLGGLSNLEILYLDQNSLEGAIPAELGSLTNLEELTLQQNHLSGAVPAELANLANLRNVSIWGNKLTWAEHYAMACLPTWWPWWPSSSQPAVVRNGAFTMGAIGRPIVL